MAGKPRSRKPASNTTPLAGVAVSVDVDLDMEPDRATVRPPRQEPDEAYALAYHPERWTVIEGRCLPGLARMPIMLGCEGVEMAQNGRPNWETIATRWKHRGFTVIPPSKAPNGRGYIKKTAVAGGFSHHTCWERLHAGSTEITSDYEGYADWIQGLFDDGFLPAPGAWCFVQLREKLQNQVFAIAQKAEHSPAIAVQLARHQADLDVVDAKIAEFDAKAPPAPSEEVSI